MNKNKLKNNKFLILLILADLLMVAVVITLAMMAWQKSQEVTNLSQQADILNQKQNSLNNLKSAASDSQKIINALFINDKTKAALIDQLEELGTQAGVEYTLNNAEDQVSLNYDVTAKGNFADLYQFISLVENLPYQVTIKSVHLAKTPSQKDQKNNNLPWTANLLIEIATLSTTEKL